nr:DsrE family protein [Sunxiuqinia sp.]
MTTKKNNIVVLWTSGDPEVAEKVCLMYTEAAKKNRWFEQVALVVWGPSAKLLSENQMLQDEIRTIQDLGVQVEACKRCTDIYGVTDQFKKMNIDVKGMGDELSNYLKEGWHSLSF